MPTTTIRLPDELKTRVAQAAERAGISPHGFILEAIAEKADQHERRDDFYTTADKRYAKIVRTGMTVPWDDMRDYLKKRLAGAPASRRVPRKIAP